MELLTEKSPQSLRGESIDIDDRWSGSRLLALFGEHKLAYDVLRQRAADEVVDPEVERFRLDVKISETQGTNASLRTRARWEAARQAGLAHRPQVVVRDWRNSARSLWRPNTLVQVVDDFLEVDGELLISTVTYTSDSGGRKATLSLARPEAFDVLAIPAKTTEPELFLTSTI